MLTKIIVNKIQSLGESTKKEEMELSLQKLEKELKEVRRERDKALQELSRLKQHLLEKVCSSMQPQSFC